VDELEHPAWCDQVHCTATVAKPGYRAGETGYHRSAPVTLAEVPNVGDMVFDTQLNPLMAHLTRAPWEPVTYVNLGPADDPQIVSLPAERARPVLQLLSALLTAADEG
jgi:hypothetical protein